jgi:glycosyltransferase involved in cell wall biosynthesis
MSEGKPVKVLHVVGVMNRAGTETMLMNIYRQIDKEKVQFDFVSYSNKEGHYDEEIRNLGGRVITLSNTQSVKDLYHVIKQNGPYQALHAHTLFHCGVANIAAILTGIPIRISHAHTTLDKNDSISRKIYIKLMRMVINMASTKRLACSKGAGKYLFGEKYLRKSSYSYFPNVINYGELLNEREEEVSNFKREVGLEDKLVFGHIGRFIDAKNHLYIIEIFKCLLKKEPNARLLLVGEGDLKQDIENRAKDEGISESIRFVGVRQDIATMLQSMDVFLFPSIYEGLGLVLLEAQAAGVPCIVSESIQPEADVGLDLFSKLNLREGAEVWAEAALSNVGKKEHNRNFIESSFNTNHYSLNQGISKLLKIYKIPGGGFMKHVLIATFDMEVGGVERSLIGMLNHFDYENYHIDLMLYSHTGDFMKLLPSKPNLLEEMTVYKTFRMSISETIKNGQIHLGFIRLIAKMQAELSFTQEKGYRQMQYMWKYSLPFLPKLSRRYDVAISYLWPHYFVAEKVEANTKIAWIHTDYSMVNTNVKLDLDLWNKFNYIIAVYLSCLNYLEGMT